MRHLRLLSTLLLAMMMAVGAKGATRIVHDTVSVDYAYYDCIYEVETVSSGILEPAITPMGAQLIAYNCTALRKPTSFTVPTTVESTITVPGKSTTITRTFQQEVKAITGLTRKVGSTTTIHGAFQGNTHLATINIPATVITIGENAFSGSRVTTISFSGTSALTTIAKKAFYNCTRLSSITLPANLTTLGASAFSGCSNLASVTLYTKLTTIGTDAFAGCKDGLQVTIKGTSGNTTVPANMFEDNTAIGKLVLYNNITAIGASAFEGCTNLSDVTLNDGLTTIGSTAFKNTSSLRNIDIPASVTSLNDAFSATGSTGLLQYVTVHWTTASAIPTITENTFPNRAHARLYVPEGTTSLYQAKDYWKEFKNIDGRTAVSEIVGTSDIDVSTIPVIGGSLTKPTITADGPAHFDIDPQNGWWQKKDGDVWRNIQEGVFTAGTWRFCCQVRIDGTNGTTHVLKEPVTVTVSGKTWSKVADDNNAFQVYATHSLLWVTSPEVTITPSAATPITVAQARAIMDATGQGTTTAETYYVQGIVKRFEQEGIYNYFYITDPDGTDEIVAYGCRKGDNDLAEGDINVGDKVIISGKLQKHNATSYDVVQPQLEQRHIAINEANFPDQNFRNQVISATNDTDHDGWLSPSEAAYSDPFMAYEKEISDLTGIGFFTNIEFLNCTKNQLTTLDLSKNTAIKYVFINYNQIQGSSMDRLIASLPEREASDNAALHIGFIFDEAEHNVITRPQVTAARAKGWEVYAFIEDSENEVIYDGLDPDAIIFADAAVKATCVANSNWDTNGDGELTYAEAAAVTSLADVYFPSSITTFDELQYFTGLTEIPAGAFSNCTSLTHITFPANVTSIGRGAFSGCSSLTDLTIPEGVTSIAEYAFQKYIGDVTLPTTLTEIGFLAFQTANSVKVKWQTPPTTFDSSAFGTGASIGATLYVPIGCLNAYRSEPWSRFNTKKEYGNIPFADANVKAICVSKWDTDGDGELSLDEAAAVTDLNKTWLVADAIAPGSSYYIRNAGTGQFLTGANDWGVQISLSTDATPYMKVKVESLPEEDQATYPNSYMLRLDGTYSFLDAEHSNTQTKTDTYLFRSLTGNYGYVDGVEGNIHGYRYFRIVKNANGYFTIQSAPDADHEINADGTEYAGANGAGAVVYFNRPGDSANTEWELIYLDESQADPFKNNTTITSFDELKYFTGLIEIPQNAFLGCTGLTSITLPSNLTAIGEDAFSGCTALTAIAVPGSVATIGERAFCSCWNLADVQLEWGLKTIGEYAFSNTSALVNINIPTTVTTLDNAFSDLDTEDPGNLKAVHVWWTSADQIPAISANTFPTRANATLYVPISYETVNGQNVEVSTASLYQAKDVWKEFGAFDRSIYFNDQKVKEVCLANWDTNHDGELSYTEAEAVTTIAQAFKGNTEIQYFNELQYFTGITDNMGAEAFDGCTSLRSITLPNTLTVVPDKAFRNCTSLTASFFIPISVTRIGDYAFQGCTGFSVGLSSNSNLTHIGAHAFEGTNLGWIYIPANVTEYGDQAFANCANLTSVTVMRTEPIAITTDPFPNRANIRLTVPAHTSEAYAAADYWKDFAPIEESEPQWHIYTDANGVKYQYEPGYNAQLYQFNKKNQETFTVAASITVDGETLPVTAMADGSVNSTSLKELYIPASVTKLKGATFGYIDALTAIHFDSSTPPAVTSQAFENWRISVTQAYNAWKSQYDVWKMKHEQWVANGREGTEPVEPAPFVEPTITLYVPAGSKSAYEAADVWKDFPIVEVEGDTDISQLDNVIYIEPTNAPIGGEISLSFKMKNSAPIVGYQFNIELPEGMSVVLDEENQPILAFNEERTSFSRHDLSASRQSDGSWLVLSGSSRVLTYKGNEGEIFTMRVRVADNMAVGDYPIILRDMKLQEADETRYYEHSRIRSTISVSEYTMGDTNGDGVIDIADYVNVAKAILGDAPAGFNRNAADIDGNGIIDITDYVGVATLILNSNNVKAQQKKVVGDIPLGTLQEK